MEGGRDKFIVEKTYKSIDNETKNSFESGFLRRKKMDGFRVGLKIDPSMKKRRALMEKGFREERRQKRTISSKGFGEGRRWRLFVFRE